MDIGAYSGVYALTAACANSSARVDVFEPNPEMVPQILENIRINGLQGRVVLHQVAISDVDGDGSLFLSAETSTAGIASLRFEPGQHPINADSDHVFVTREVKVSVMRLDSLDLPPIDLVKIDAEGSEPQAFGGAANTFRRDQPIILSEALDGRALSAQQAVLSELGYLPPVPVDAHGSHGDDCNFLWSTPLSAHRLAAALNGPR